MDEKKKKKSLRRGALFLSLWFILIWMGIFDKHILGHADMMVFFHLPAAVFLVLGGYELSRKFRARYRESLERYAKKALRN